MGEDDCLYRGPVRVLGLRIIRGVLEKGYGLLGGFRHGIRIIGH